MYILAPELVKKPVLRKKDIVSKHDGPTYCGWTKYCSTLHNKYHIPSTQGITVLWVLDRCKISSNHDRCSWKSGRYVAAIRSLGILVHFISRVAILDVYKQTMVA